MSKIEVQNLCRSFGAVKALDQVSFAVPDGRIYGLIGPNGSGKTTCLRILAGMDEADSGKILVDGTDVTDYPETLRRSLALMPDTLPDSTNFKVWEYLDYFGRAYDLSSAARRAAVERAARLTNLADLMTRRLCNLSKGMKQQVSLARVLIQQPKIMLLDEPAAGLDPRARIEFRQTMQTIAGAGISVLISSHILSELEDMVHGVILLEKGKLLRAGELSEALRKTSPVQRCVADVAFAGNAADFLERVRGLDFIEAAEPISPKQIRVTLKGGEESFKTAMSQMILSDLPVCGFSRPDQTLEGLFLNTTTKGGVQ